MLTRTLALCAALLLGPSAIARVHPRAAKFFPADRDSVLRENLAANEMGAYRYFTQAQVDTDVYAGNLSALYDNMVYIVSPKLPMERRYALPATTEFVYNLSREFYITFKQPLMVDSAIRPATTQRGLHLSSAAPAYGPRASTHERGTSVDLSKRMTKAQHDWLVM